MLDPQREAKRRPDGRGVFGGQAGRGLEEGRVWRRDAKYGVVVPDAFVGCQPAQALSVRYDLTVPDSDPAASVFLRHPCGQGCLGNGRLSEGHKLLVGWKRGNLYREYFPWASSASKFYPRIVVARPTNGGCHTARFALQSRIPPLNRGVAVGPLGAVSRDCALRTADVSSCLTTATVSSILTLCLLPIATSRRDATRPTPSSRSWSSCASSRTMPPA